MGWSDFLLGAAEKFLPGGSNTTAMVKRGLGQGYQPNFRLPRERRSSVGTPYYLGAPDSGNDFDFGLDTGLAGGMRRRPRMNVMNSHAARRAVRRLRGALKLLHRIERTMPHRTCKRTHTKGRFGR